MTAYAEWTYITKTETHDREYFIDLSSIKNDGDKRTYWVLTNFKKSQKAPNGKLYQSIKLRTISNCKDETSEDVSIVYYSKPKGSGDIVFNIDIPSYQRVSTSTIPDSVGQDLQNKVCGNSETSKEIIGEDSSVPLNSLKIVYRPDTDIFYPRLSKKNNEEGYVGIQIFIDESGTVIDSNVIDSSGYERLDKAGQELSKRIRFEPYRINNVASKVNTKISIKFQLGTEKEINK